MVEIISTKTLSRKKSHKTHPTKILNMKTKLFKNRSIYLSVMILFLFLSNYCNSQTTDNNWWSEIIKEHKINRSDYREIKDVIIFSDSISDTKDLIYFDYPIYIAKGIDNYYIYSVDSVIFSKRDSIVNLYNGISVGFAKSDKGNKPISISEFSRVINKIKKKLMISVQSKPSFSWLDQEYFSKKNNNIVRSKKE